MIDLMIFEDFAVNFSKRDRGYLAVDFAVIIWAKKIDELGPFWQLGMVNDKVCYQVIY